MTKYFRDFVSVTYLAVQINPNPHDMKNSIRFQKLVLPFLGETVHRQGSMIFRWSTVQSKTVKKMCPCF